VILFRDSNCAFLQGDLVRSLKSKGTPKSELQPHINRLLELKEQLKNAAPSGDAVSYRIFPKSISPMP